MEKGPIVITVLGLAILLAGILRFVKLGHFTLAQAAYCLLSIPVAMLLLDHNSDRKSRNHSKKSAFSPITRLENQPLKIPEGR